MHQPPAQIGRRVLRKPMRKVNPRNESLRRPICQAIQAIQLFLSVKTLKNHHDTHHNAGTADLGDVFPESVKGEASGIG
jgi:hypothetical protein